MTIEQQILQKLAEIENDIKILDQKIEEGKFKNDVVSNEKYCELRTQSGAHLTVPGLLKWFEKGCPREDSRHVSIAKVNEWARNKNTRQARA